MKKGFTILEVILAISLLSFGVIGVWSFLQQITPFASTIISREIASYLLEEGIEIVRNIRDSNWLAGENWDSGISAGEWEADYNSGNLNQNYLGRYLNIDSRGFYSYSAGTKTKFKRKIKISRPSSEIIEVLVEIQWQEKGQNYSLSGQENLYNWYSPL